MDNPHLVMFLLLFPTVYFLFFLRHFNKSSGTCGTHVLSGSFCPLLVSLILCDGSCLAPSTPAQAHVSLCYKLADGTKDLCTSIWSLPVYISLSFGWVKHPLKMSSRATHSPSESPFPRCFRLRSKITILTTQMLPPPLLIPYIH